jgi:ribose transport system substrate-binding protein
MRVKILTTIISLVGIAVLVTACGSSSSSSSSSGNTSSNGGSGESGSGGSNEEVAWLKEFKPPASGCGSFEAQFPPDPEGALKELDAAHRETYRGFGVYPKSPIEVLKSPWSNWKPSHAAPYKVAIVWGSKNNASQIDAVNLMEKELNEAGITTSVSTTNGFDPTQAVQNLQAAIREHPDLIIAEAQVPEAFLPVIDDAAKEGIPTITAQGAVATANAVNIEPNFFLAGAVSMSAASRLMGEEGEALYVHGIAGTGPDVQAQNGWEAVLKNCSGMKVAGEIEGQYDPSIAKSETLKFLATHPQEIGAVVQPGAMSVGIVEAFEQSGRPTPIVPDFGTIEKGLIGYAQQNPSEFVYLATSYTPAANAGSAVDVARRMLAGQGVKLNMLVGEMPLITPFNVEELADPSWTLQTPGTVTGTQEPFTPKYLEAFFERPAPLE